METKGKIILWAIGGTVLGAQAVYAHDAGQANAGYRVSGDPSGHLVTGHSGHCVKITSWTPALAIATCDPQ